MSENNSGTMTTPLLPWAAEWGGQRPRGNLVFAAVFVVLLLIFSIPFAIDAANQGNMGRTVFGAAIFLVALTSLIAVVPILRVRRKKLPRDIETSATVDSSRGVRVFYLSSWRRALILWLTAGTLFLLIRGWLFFKQLSDDSEGSARSQLSAGGLVIVVIVLGMIAVLGWYLFSSRHRRGFVALTADGVVQRLGHTVKRLPWSEIGGAFPGVLSNVHVVDIVPVPGHKVNVDSGKSWLDNMQRGSLEKSIQVPAWVLGMDPALFLYLVRFYWQHPEARQELATEAVVNRMRSGELLG
ncbi:hypothetical protein NDR87_06135 [Nocardia sp. CDC159]|uniref:Uncharacterized protein n=1 Tax=Nocardia pulmonis TaxID=2951408 RepID=A0A9X2E345_9NOCA|nr:hypothetical protein [Nocardia pulmonis]MCM6772761.1 hypothetical protein [Nocardia pulmonis]MCM6785936.1 hypothetical protein [Nocardia sp. CDC159]